MEQKQFQLEIKKIKEIEFFVNEDNPSLNLNAVFIRFELNTIPTAKDNTVEMILTVFYSEISNDKVFMRIKTSNVFSIQDMATLHNTVSNTVEIPDNILVTMLSLSITHTRALLAKSASGTKFAELYIPIVNPTLLLNQLFKKNQLRNDGK